MSRPYIIWWAVAVHVAWGFALIVDPTASPAAILIGLHWVVALGVDGPLLGFLLLVVAALAVVSMIADKRLSNLVSFALLMPQFSLLVAAFLSDSQSVVTGVLPDGRNVDQLLLFTALWPTMVAAVLHSIAIIERHRVWTRH